MTQLFHAKPANAPNTPRTFDAAREANHRIANNLALIVSALRLQSRAIGRDAQLYTAEDVRMLLAEAAARIDAVTHLHRALSHDFNADEVDIGAHLRTVCDSLVAAFVKHGATSIVYDLSPCKVSPHHAASLGLIVTELVTNAIKYSHPTGIDGVVQVRCHSLPSGALQIEVSDDGVGLPEKLDPKTTPSLGFELVRALALPMDACITFKDEGLGLSVRLDVPAQDSNAAA